jgi:hypothetical protein
MVGPLGVLAACPAVTTTDVEDINGGPPWGVLAAGPTAATTEVEDVDDGPPGRAGARGLGLSTINTKKHQRRAPKRCQSWRPGSAAPAELTTWAGR